MGSFINFPISQSLDTKQRTSAYYNSGLGSAVLNNNKNNNVIVTLYGLPRFFSGAAQCCGSGFKLDPFQQL